MAIKLVLFVLKVSGSKLEVILLLFFLISSHYSLKSQDLGKIVKVYNIADQKQDMKAIWSKGIIVLTFYSPDCPLSIKYTKTMNELAEKFDGRVSFYVVFSGSYHDRSEIDAFVKKYQISSDVLFDPKFKLADEINASITPEVFLINHGKVSYSGAIDDWVIKLGVTKKQIQNAFLENAINEVLKNEDVTLNQTKAIGCFIR